MCRRIHNPPLFSFLIAHTQLMGTISRIQRKLHSGSWCLCAIATVYSLPLLSDTVADIVFWLPFAVPMCINLHFPATNTKQKFK